jgi:hypothetical protein
MRFLPRALVAGGVGFAVSCLAACGGGSGLLSPDQAASISSDANQLASAVAARDCGEARSANGRLGNDVANLPSTINRTVQANLSQAAQTVGSLALTQCAQPTTAATTAATATTTATTATTPPPTTVTTTPPTNTVTTSTATTSTPTGTTSTQPTGGGGLGAVTTSGGGGAPGG